MTPQERAEQINREEREAERADLMRRALAYAAQTRAEERARALGVEIVEHQQAPVALQLHREAKRYDWQGEKLTLAHIATRLDLNLHTLRGRIYRGIPLADAVNGKRSKSRIPIHRIGAEQKTLHEWCEHFGANYQIVTRRLRHGVPLATALTMPSGARLADWREHVPRQVADDDARPASTLDRPAEGQTDRLDLADRPKGPGVPSDLGPLMGTGAGSTARETTNITFPEKAAAE